LRHLGKPRALAAEQLLAAARRLVEVVDVAISLHARRIFSQGTQKGALRAPLATSSCQDGYFAKLARNSFTACLAFLSSALISLRDCRTDWRSDLSVGRSSFPAPFVCFAAARSAFS
jgi:hypothetical protein